MSKLVNPTSCTNEKKHGSGIREGRTIVSSHYVVVAERLLHVYALLPLRLQTGTKPKWQMGRKGGGCDAGKGVCEHAVRHACSPLGDRPMPTRTSPAPSTTRKCMPCTLLYNETVLTWESCREKKMLCDLLHKGSRNMFERRVGTRGFSRLFRYLSKVTNILRRQQSKSEE